MSTRGKNEKKQTCNKWVGFDDKSWKQISSALYQRNDEKERERYRENNIAKVARDVAELLRHRIDAVRHDVYLRQLNMKRKLL